jgi:hypothetical protein
MERGWISCVLLVTLVASPGCETPEPPRERIEIAAAHRACEDGDGCGVVETSCTSQGCECGVAVNEAYLAGYQKELAECRGQTELASCEFECEKPFGRCFEGACVLTSEPPELFRRGRSLQAVCEKSRGNYVGCPDCPPNTRCKACVPCECPSSHRWTRKGCQAVVKTEARDIRIETRPARLTLDDKVKTRVHNDSRRKIWLKSVCGTPFHRARKKEDAWEKSYEAFGATKCRVGAIEIDPGESRPFVIANLRDFTASSEGAPTPGTYRFELTYTDGSESFEYSSVVYSAEFDLVTKVSSR